MALLDGPRRGSPWSTTAIEASGGPRAALAIERGLFADQAESEAAGQLDGWAEHGISVLSYRDCRYPRRLADWDGRPPLLFVRGQLVGSDGDGIAVIGTRAPSGEGVRTARELAAAITAAGQTVISGLAHGIDTAAHEGALEAGGRSVAVLGNGVQRAYPAANADLQRRLHALVSQFRPERSPSRETFPMRNAVMSGLSRATVVVEAGERSGARIQARHALAQGRPLFLMPPVLEQQWARALAERDGVQVIGSGAELLGALR